MANLTTGKWRVFKEKVPADMKPLWVVWDESEEFLFQTGAEALDFVRKQLDSKTRKFQHWYAVPTRWYEAADAYTKAIFKE